MKVVTNIPDESYNRIIKIDNPKYEHTKWIQNGTPLGKCTNGKVMLSMYPNIELEIIDDIVNVYGLCRHCVTFDTDWWNAPYKEERK